MAAYEDTPFSDLVASAFSADQEAARTLWGPLAQQFDRGDPAAVKEYLEAQRQQLAGYVKELLRQVKEQIDD